MFSDLATPIGLVVAPGVDDRTSILEQTGRIHGSLLVATPAAGTSASWPSRRLSVADDALNHFFVTGMGEDATGELYVMARHQFGPIGQTGFVFRIVPPVS